MSPLSKVFNVMEIVVSNQDRGLTYSEIVGLTGLPKASVHRIVKDLTGLGYLTYNPETKKYSGSLKLAALGADVMANFNLRDHVRPHLLQLHKQTGHTSNLGIRNNDVGVFADKIESQYYGIKLFSEIGKTFPLHCTALGKALLASSPPEDVEHLLSEPLEAVTEKSITDPRLLRKELDKVRERGYALDDQEITRGIMCVAAPVHGVNEETICAISITFPSYVNEDRGIKAEIDAIREFAALISGTLGKR